MGPMTTAMLVGIFFMIAGIAALVSLLPFTYAIRCLLRKRYFQSAFILLVGTSFGILSLLFGVLMMSNNVVGLTVMQSIFWGGASWFVIGFAGPALGVSAVILIKNRR